MAELNQNQDEAVDLSTLDFSNLGALMMGGGLDADRQKEKAKKDVGREKSRGSGGSARGHDYDGFIKRDSAPQEEEDYGSYIGAPYNFVPFPERVRCAAPEAIPAHNAVSDDLVSGEIEWTLTAETPILVDGGQKKADGTPSGEFWRDAYNRPAIPGSTVRGLIRANAQILGFASVADDVDDYALMYRNVASGAEKKRYNDLLGANTVQLQAHGGKKPASISVLKNVRAGYLANEEGCFVIYRTVLDTKPGKAPIGMEFGVMNYYILSERKISLEFENWKSGGKRNAFSYDFFQTKSGQWRTMHLLDKGFKEVEDDKNNNRNNNNRNNNNRNNNNRNNNNRDNNKKKGRIHYKGTKNPSYRPYAEPVTYGIANRRYVTSVHGPDGQGQKGYAVSTGFMNEKKAVYIIPEIDKSKDPIAVPAESIESFRIDMQKRENTLRTFGGRECFDLPEQGTMRPVFYIELGGRLYFGFTPRLRLFYDDTVKKGLPKSQTESGMDCVKALFGAIDAGTGNGSRKGRVSFSDMVVTAGGEEAGEDHRILAEPKPTSYLDYLVQNGEKGTTCNTEGFQLRGVKQYWIHDSVNSDGKPGEGKEKVSSVLRPLQKGTVFTGKVRFRNLTHEELGLLLWSMRLEENSRMNVGKGKSFGYGRVAPAITAVRQLEPQQAYTLSGSLNLNPFRTLNEAEIREQIQEYKDSAAGWLGLENGRLEEVPSISTFLLMKDAGRIPKENRIRYMSIDNREYQSRTKPLRAPEAYAKPAQEKKPSWKKD